MYFAYIETGYATEMAQTSEEAKQEALDFFIEMLQKGEIEIHVEEED